MARYKVLSVDVWGNSIDGYDTNEIVPTGREIELPENADADVVRRALKADRWVPANLRNAAIGCDPQGEWSPGGCDSWWITDERTPRRLGPPEDNAEGYGRPLYELRLIVEDPEDPVMAEPVPVDDTDGPSTDLDSAILAPPLRLRGSAAFRRVAARAARKGFGRPALMEHSGGVWVVIPTAPIPGFAVNLPCTRATAARTLRSFLRPPVEPTVP